MHGLQNLHAASRTAMRSSGSSPFPQMFSDGAFIIGHGFSFLYGDGVGGTGGQAVPETIAVVIAQKHGPAVFHGDGTFVTGADAEAAAGALFPINMDNLSFHAFLP